MHDESLRFTLTTKDSNSPSTKLHHRESAMLKRSWFRGFAKTERLEVTFMEVLKKLFEQHFHAPPERIQPLQGDLGGSGRKIIRLANEKDRAVGILYAHAIENADG